MPGVGQATGDVALYGVRGANEIVQFNSHLATGYRLISPIARYFASESKVVGLAYGLGIDHGDAKVGPDPNRVSNVLLTFDRKGALLSTDVLDPNLKPEQLAAFSSGDLLLVAWDKVRKMTYLSVTDAHGSTQREIHFRDNDPADDGNGSSPLATLTIYPYGEHLLLVPQDTRRPIVEVNEHGVLNSYTMKIPAGYTRGLALSFGRRSWKFRMLKEDNGSQPVQAAQTDGNSKIGLASLQSIQGIVLEFNPDDGNVIREIDLPQTGFQPACENNGEVTFVSARAGDGKLQIAKGVAAR
jgi:hypothetical protein